MPKYKWDSKKWENDDEWWNPYNPKGRPKGKGTTSWARQLRRQAMQPDAQQPLEKEAEKQQELAEGKPAALPQPLEKKANRWKPAAKQAIGKMAEEDRPGFGKKSRSIRKTRRKER